VALLTTIVLAEVVLVDGSIDYNFSLQLDATPPQIHDNSASTGSAGEPYVFSFTLMDTKPGGGNGSGISAATAYYWSPGGAVTAISLNKVNDTLWEQTIVLDRTAHQMTYYAETYDRALNYNQTGDTVVTLSDLLPPQVDDVRGTPYVQRVGEPINITATITDNWGISTVILHIPTVGQSFVMENSGTLYYKEVAYNLTGSFTYYIDVTDTSGNTNGSGMHSFEIVSGALVSTGYFHLYTPIDVYENSEGILLVKLLDRYLGTPMSGSATMISCYIQYPNGTMFVNGEHPIQDAPGLYLLAFVTGEVFGIYHCWTICNYSENLTLMDAGLFTVKWNVYENVSRLYERIGSIIFLGHWENYNMTQQVTYQLGTHQLILQNVSRLAQKTDFITNLQQITLSQAINVLFWTIILSTVGTFGAVYFTRRKGMRGRLLAASTSAPQALVVEVTEMDKLRKRGKRR
jgi:hypothetical protein